MAKSRIVLRTLTAEEEREIRRRARSQTAPRRQVQRAQLILAMREDPDLDASRAGMQVGYRSNASGPFWVKRFNASGLAGLEDEPRTGRPVTHDETVRSQLIDLVLQKPGALGYPFELWTVTRLQTAFKERHGLKLGAATIWRWVKAEGLNWKRQQSWFHEPEKHDPEFAEKRGPSSRRT